MPKGTKRKNKSQLINNLQDKHPVQHYATIGLSNITTPQQGFPKSTCIGYQTIKTLELWIFRLLKICRIIIPTKTK
jgi:hypothetical protein